MIDLTQIENAGLMLAATALTVFGSAALAAIAKHFNIQYTAGQQAAYDTQLANAANYGVAKAEGMIAKNGWNHVATKDAILDTALQYVISRAPDALAGVGLDDVPNSPKNQEIVRQALMARLPGVMTAAVASPATPPASAPDPAPK